MAVIGAACGAPALGGRARGWALLAAMAALAWNAIAAALFMVVMMTARESSMIFAFIACGVLLAHRRYVAAIAMLAGWAAGAAIVHHAAGGAQNVHRMPELLYLISKIPLNFVRNWLGVLVWTN